MGNTSTDPARLAADIHELSYFVIGFCLSTPNDEWTIGGVDCPAAHRLELSLWDGNNERILRGNSAIPVPWMTITDTPRTLHLRLDWLRPAGIVRTDQLSVVGLPGGFRTGFSSTWPSPAVLDVPDRHSRAFSVVIDPAQVAGASGPNGRVLRIKAYASYATTAFRIGVGNIPVGFAFETEFPILVLYNGPQPTTSQQPANLGVSEGQPASFSVIASITPAAALTYQWSRRASASAAFAPIAGATAASHNLAATALSDHGAEFQVQVCAGSTRCVPSSVATLSVSAVTIAPVFTISPVDQMVAAGQTASLHAVATGAPLPQIRWQHAPAGSNSFADITGVPACGTTHSTSGAANVAASCTVDPLAVADSGQQLRHRHGDRRPGGTGHHAAARAADHHSRRQRQLQRHGKRHRAAELRLAAKRHQPAVAERRLQRRRLQRYRDLQQRRQHHHARRPVGRVQRRAGQRDGEQRRQPECSQQQRPTHREPDGHVRRKRPRLRRGADGTGAGSAMRRADSAAS